MRRVAIIAAAVTVVKFVIIIALVMSVWLANSAALAHG